MLFASAVFTFFVTPIISFPLQDPHIIGGDVASEDRLYEVSLITNGKHFCGGAMVSDSSIVTAAHCVYRVNSKISVRAGSLRRDEGKVYEVDSKSIKIMSCYDPHTQDCDVAVLKLKSKVPNIIRLKLVSQGSEPQDGSLLVVTGWGMTSSGSGSMASVLQVAKLKKISRDNCRYSYTGINRITDNMICGGDQKRNICVGDSGGPLVDTSGRLVGVVSHGVTDASNKHCNPQFPGVFANIATPQINQFIAKNI